MIHLVRHAEPAAQWSEHPDPGLSSRGRTQAVMAAERLMSLGPGIILTSPLIRCRETAQPSERSMSLHARLAPEFGEIAAPAGVADRASWLKSAMGGTWNDLGDDYLAWRERMFASLSRLPAGTVVFSHFVAINAIVGRITRDDRVLVFRPGHASITSISVRGGELSIASLGEKGPIDAI